MTRLLIAVLALAVAACGAAMAPRQVHLEPPSLTIIPYCTSINLGIAIPPTNPAGTQYDILTSSDSVYNYQDVMPNLSAAKGANAIHVTVSRPSMNKTTYIRVLAHLSGYAGVGITSGAIGFCH